MSESAKQEARFTNVVEAREIEFSAGYDKGWLAGYRAAQEQAAKVADEALFGSAVTYGQRLAMKDAIRAMTPEKTDE